MGITSIIFCGDMEGIDTKKNLTTGCVIRSKSDSGGNGNLPINPHIHTTFIKHQEPMVTY